MALLLWPKAWAIPVARVSRALRSWLGLATNTGFLALTYLAGTSLLVAASTRLERWLTTLFGAVGQLAFTTYILHFAVISIVFDNYGLAAPKLTPQWVPVAGVMLFGLFAVASRWWLARFRWGPAEWFIRSLTYARLQPIRRLAPAA